jgi:hypothetical protein
MEMKSTIEKEVLLEKLRENRERHRTVFLEALKGYREHAEKVLAEHIASLKDGRSPEIRISISRPEDHTQDYDRVIGMVELDQGVYFTLDEHAYAEYMMDDWVWKRQWLKMSSGYAPEAAMANYHVTDGDF